MCSSVCLEIAEMVTWRDVRCDIEMIDLYSELDGMDRNATKEEVSERDRVATIR